MEEILRKRHSYVRFVQESIVTFTKVFSQLDWSPWVEKWIKWLESIVTHCLQELWSDAVPKNRNYVGSGCLCCCPDTRYRWTYWWINWRCQTVASCEGCSLQRLLKNGGSFSQIKVHKNKKLVFKQKKNILASLVVLCVISFVWLRLTECQFSFKSETAENVFWKGFCARQLWLAMKLISYLLKKHCQVSYSH